MWAAVFLSGVGSAEWVRCLASLHSLVMVQLFDLQE